VSKDIVHSASVDISAIQDDVLAADAGFSDLVTKVPLPAGTVLRKSQFVTRPEIEVGDRVLLRYQSHDISIEATALALQSSHLGQRVLVRAPVGDEVIAARTVARGVAEVLQ
jgi:flagella basal body P-ring formation protein FlgA